MVPVLVVQVVVLGGTGGLSNGRRFLFECCLGVPDETCVVRSSWSRWLSSLVWVVSVVQVVV